MAPRRRLGTRGNRNRTRWEARARDATGVFFWIGRAGGRFGRGRGRGDLGLGLGLGLGGRALHMIGGRVSGYEAWGLGRGDLPSVAWLELALGPSLVLIMYYIYSPRRSVDFSPPFSFRVLRRGRSGGIPASRSTESSSRSRPVVPVVGAEGKRQTFGFRRMHLACRTHGSSTRTCALARSGSGSEQGWGHALGCSLRSSEGTPFPPGTGTHSGRCESGAITHQ
ncbi:hypothetical protein OF83DRAFT_749006 [Amylostereum chailletii]|nr:hypothetical protein OF83DRAFT_749006 [Amylostereum chailletii]